MPRIVRFVELVYGAGRIDRRVTDAESLLREWRVKEKDWGQLYHLAVDEALREAAAQYVLVFVEVDDETRRRRLAEREGLDVDLGALDRHSTEREVPRLRERAAAVVGGADIAAAVVRVRELSA